MTMPPYGPVSPYVSPQMLISAPTGISWNTIPPGSGVTPAMRLAEQANICNRATSEADGYINQIIRATTDTEIYHGPGDYRVNIQQYTGICRIVLQRWPVISVNSVKVAPNAVFPRQWTEVTTGYYEPEYPPSGIFGSVVPTGSGDGGQAIIISPGYVNWCLGRWGYVIQVQYTNGWPHAGLAASCLPGDTTIQVDDCTGWAIPQFETQVVGATGTIFDAAQQEIIQVSGASVASGPGVLTLASPLQFAHDSNTGIIVSTVPRDIQWAVILLASAEALARGATSTTVQEVAGRAQNSSERGDSLRHEAHKILNTFRRVILCRSSPRSRLCSGSCKDCRCRTGTTCWKCTSHRRILKPTIPTRICTSGRQRARSRATRSTGERCLATPEWGRTPGPRRYVTR